MKIWGLLLIFVMGAAQAQQKPATMIWIGEHGIWECPTVVPGACKLLVEFDIKALKA